MSKNKNPNPKKAVKSVKDIKPQAPVNTTAVAVIEPPAHTVARSPLNFEWIKFFVYTKFSMPSECFF